MCQCNPNIRTPWCGKGDCVIPKQERYENIQKAIPSVLGNVTESQLNLCNEISNDHAITGDEAFVLVKIIEEKYLGYFIYRLEETRDIKKVLHEYFTKAYRE